ncbi:hypothetical protein [Halomicrobium salinisoli]|uniref:hypothetical protein n=1 Tax=Halomicrobium salinisoli TaxID=2878391 RepID=UPI001CF0061D|nr:hypothetical protein [Halomicrobium salinisoli]
MEDVGRDSTGPHDPSAVRPSVDEEDLDVECWWCRAVVAYLLESGGVATPGAVARAIASTRGDAALDDVDPEPARERLVARHLPALANAGVVLWFETDDAETVVLEEDLLTRAGGSGDGPGPGDHIDRE